jgi:predicted 3-demethylubiquinone-9 3-methyltransferase (glyoxalase superfamily)
MAIGNSQVKTVTRYGATGPDPNGSVMTIAFELVHRTEIKKDRSE